MSLEEKWWETQVRLKEKKVVAKLRYPNGSFWTSIQIPTVYWPLNRESYEVFHCDNTAEVSDMNLIRTFDEVEYQLGRCYTNSKRLHAILKDLGYQVKTYAGWLFVLEDIPIHHCWVVLEKDGAKSVLDLADDYPQSILWQKENVPNWPHVTREDHANWVAASLKMKNSIRCNPIGRVTPEWYYVGCECEPELAGELYSKLMAQYPNHICDPSWSKGKLNPTQTLLLERGLI